MHYLITGGAGFIGSHLAEALLGGGHRVTILDDLSTGRASNVEHLRGLIEEAKTNHISVLNEELAFTIKQRLERMMSGLSHEPQDMGCLMRVTQLAELVRALPLEVNYWQVRNLYLQMMERVLPEWRYRAGKGDEQGRVWLNKFLALGEHIGFAVKQLEV